MRARTHAGDVGGLQCPGPEAFPARTARSNASEGHTDRRRRDQVRPDRHARHPRASERPARPRMRVRSVRSARTLLAQLGIVVASRVVRIGEVVDETRSTPTSPAQRPRRRKSPVRVLDSGAAERIMKNIDASKEAGDTLGGVFEVVAGGMPIGFGFARAMGSAARRPDWRSVPGPQPRSRARTGPRLPRFGFARLGRTRCLLSGRERRAHTLWKQSRGRDRGRHLDRTADRRAGRHEADPRP